MWSQDLTVPLKGYDLYTEGLAKYLIVSWGYGKITRKKFDKTEAEIFSNILIDKGIAKEKILLEDKSSNTAENIKFSLELCKKNDLQIKKVILVNKPYLERRVFATVKKNFPELEVFVTSPTISFEEYLNGVIDSIMTINLMVGDIQRIIIYPKKGFQIQQNIPKEVMESYTKLIELGFNEQLIKD